MKQEDLSSFNKELEHARRLWEHYVCPNIMDLLETGKRSCFVTISEYCTAREIRLLGMLLTEWDLRLTIMGWTKGELIIEIIG